MKKTRNIALGLTLLCLAACSACSAKPCPPRLQPPRPMAPPAVYLQAVPEPKLKGETNGDLAAWALDLRAALRQSNQDKKALQKWLTDQGSGPGPGADGP